MKKIYLYLDGFTRCYPLILYFYSFLSALINDNFKTFLFGIILVISDCFNHIIKEHMFRPLMKNDNIFLLGNGNRPNNIDSGLFRTGLKSESYGMPSGHSQVTWLFTTYWILNILGSKREKYKKIITIIILILVALIILYSRVYMAKVHTVQQVIIGSFIGIFFGYGAHKLLNL